MEFSNEELMLLFFILFLGASIWKIWAFLPNSVLVDDDTTEASQEELLHLVLKTIKRSHAQITPSELFELIKEDSSFDTKHFWRFNLNKLNQLLKHYYLQHPDISSIEDIYKKIA